MVNMAKLTKLLAFIMLNTISLLYISDAVAQEKINRFKIGDAKAPVVIYEFVSLACSHCVTFNQEVLPLIKSEYIDKKLVQIIFIDVPFGPTQNAYAHAILYKAKNLSQFELLTSLFFKNQQTWLTSSNPNKEVANLARLAGLTNDEISQAIEDVAFQELLKSQSMEYLKNLNIQGTPTLLISKLGSDMNSANNIKIEGVEKYGIIKQSIDKVLKNN